MFEQEESQQPCVMCHQPNEQMLMLSCVHDPCVNCAAVHYVENEPHNSLNYTCAKCGQTTQLDSSSVAELQKVYSLQKNKKRYRNQPSTVSQKDKPEPKQYNDAYETRQPKQYAKSKTGDNFSHSREKDYAQPASTKYNAPNPVSQPSYSTAANKKTGYQIMYPCSDHQDEQLTYFCFTCHKPICPECAIHGSHKDHEVQTTRKAIKHIKQLLLQDKQKLDAEINVLATNRDNAKKLSKQWVEENKRDQDYIRKKLAQLRSLIAEKEKELIVSTQVNLERNCEILRNEAMASEKVIENVIGVKREIENTFKKQDLTILQEFNKRDAETNNAVQFADRQKDKLRDQQAKNPLKALNLDVFEQDIDRLIAEMQNLQLTVTSSTP